MLSPVAPVIIWPAEVEPVPVMVNRDGAHKPFVHKALSS
jgi:hypothetical protein